MMGGLGYSVSRFVIWYTTASLVSDHCEMDGHESNQRLLARVVCPSVLQCVRPGAV
jgi:hypothetical protein